MKNNTSRKNRVIKITVAIVAVVFVLLICVVFGAANFLVNYAIGRGGDGANRNVSLAVEGPKSDIQKLDEANTALQYARNDIFVDSVEIKEVQISSQDNLKLKAYYATVEDSDLWAIAIHGYRGNHVHMTTYAERYYNQGFNVLTPDLRACGESEGKFVGMGWKDKEDILLWINWILEQNPNAKIVIHGHSMGGATTMMVSGENTPDNVVAFVEDCGYTTVWGIFASELKLRFHLPTFPILHTASIISHFKAGYTFKEASALEQVKKCKKPMMFIHGTTDGFIPYSMMPVLYDAKSGDNKKMLTVEGAGHCRAVYILYDEYWNEVFDFLNNYL